MKRSVAVVAGVGSILFATSCRERVSSESADLASPPADSARRIAAPAPLLALLDSGNVAFRAQDYARARDLYLRATEIDSMFAAAWFGVYMAEDKLGNTVMAEFAMERAQR